MAGSLRADRFLAMNNGYIVPKRERMTTMAFASGGLPARKGPRPKTIAGPLHIQCNGHGEPKYLNRLLNDVLSWPYVEPTPPASRSSTIPIRLTEDAIGSDASAFISTREFARVLLGAPTIILALPLICAHWAILKGWAEPHYLRSFGLMPPGAVLVYTPKNREDLAVCCALFSESYRFACGSVVR
jgi:hypothetical protein